VLAVLDEEADAAISRKNSAGASVAGVSAMAKANASRTPESLRSDASGDREAVQLRILNQRGEKVALAFPIVRSAVSFQP
jgi:hypothetical protein